MITTKRFTASWCQPCKMLAPLIKSLESEFPDITFETIDVDDNPEASAEFNIRSVPQVIILKNGVEVNRLVGLQVKKNYVDALTQVQ